MKNRRFARRRRNDNSEINEDLEDSPPMKEDSKYRYIDKYGKYCEHCGEFYISNTVNSDYDTDNYESEEDSE